MLSHHLDVYFWYVFKHKCVKHSVLFGSSCVVSCRGYVKAPFAVSKEQLANYTSA